MNENLDLTKILEGCPVGTEFYSTIYGKCYFAGITNYENYPIKLDFFGEKGEYHNDRVTIDGRHRVEYDGDCTLLPSKDQRDWSKFERSWDKPKKFDPKTLKPFDKVLAKDGFSSKWTCTFFSHIDNGASFPVFCSGGYFKVCIPYNDETKHLVGTKEDCPEYYKSWEE